MAKSSATRGVFVRLVCLLAITLVCVMGVVQAVHAHSENSLAAHHGCSICLSAHAGLTVETATVAPTLVAAALAIPSTICPGVLRQADVHFIRPPPAA
jgi:hypothetical protein